MKNKTEKSEVITKIRKNFDAVKMMREIRDKISKDIKGMSFEEEQVYIEKTLAKKKKV